MPVINQFHLALRGGMKYKFPDKMSHENSKLEWYGLPLQKGTMGQKEQFLRELKLFFNAFPITAKKATA